MVDEKRRVKALCNSIQ